MLNKRFAWLLLFLWVVVHVFLFWFYGIRNMFDADVYVRAADFLLVHGRLEDAQLTFYVVPISIMAFFRLLFPGQVLPFLIFQSLLSGLAMIALYRAGSKIFNTLLAGFLSCLLFLLWWDYIHWNTALMTESLACSLTIFVIYRLTRFKASLKDYAWLFVLTVACLCTRPTGAVVIVGILFFLLNYYRYIFKGKPFLRAGTVTVLVALLYVGASLLANRWDFTGQYVKGNIITYADDIKGTGLDQGTLGIDPKGIVLPDTAKAPLQRMAHFAVSNPVYFMELAVWKVWYLVTSVRPYYSVLHNVCSLAWVIAMYTLYYLGWRHTGATAVKVCTLVIIILNCCLIGISSADWDNRFYVTMEPGIVLLAGGGAATLWMKREKIISNQKS